MHQGFDNARTHIPVFPSTNPFSPPLSPSLRVFTPFSYFPIHRSTNVIVSLRSSSVGLSLLHFYVLFTSEVHVSLSGSLVHFAAALFPIFVLPRFVSVYRNICSSCEHDKREYFMHFRPRRKRGNTRPVGSSGSVNFSILPSLSLMRSSTEANGSAWRDFQNNGARVAWHHSQHHLWSSFWQDKAFCICTHTFHEFHRIHRTERFFVQNSSKVDSPWLQKVIRQFPLQVFSVVAHLSENSFGHSTTILSALSSFQPEEHRRSLPPRIHSFSLSLSRSLIPCVSWPLARSSSPLSLSDIFVTEVSPLALFRAK